MIIELVGLPGGGKTTLAKALASQGAELIATPSRGVLVLDTFLFSISHPVRALRIFWLIFSRAPRGARYELFVNAFFVYTARYREAKRLSKRGKVAILDQGYFQLLVSLGTPARKAMGAFPRPDVLVVVSANEALREERMRSRGRTPREEWGEEERARWEREGEQTLAVAFPQLRSLTRVVEYDGAQDASAGAKHLLTRAPKRASSGVRGVGKYLLLASSYLVSRVAKLFNNAPEALVLMYHATDYSGWKLSITPEEFEKQMAYIAKHAKPVALSEVVEYAKGKRKLPACAIAVTFDDGYQDVLTAVLPILMRYGIPATVFVPSDLSAVTGPGERARLTESELKELIASGLISIESHGKEHRKFTELTVDEREKEARESRDELERMTGVRPRYFAYPFGARSAEVEQAVEQNGYEAAFGITEGVIYKGSDLFGLPRVQIDATMSSALFKLRLTSAVEWNRRLVRALRGIIPV